VWRCIFGFRAGVIGVQTKKPTFESHKSVNLEKDFYYIGTMESPKKKLWLPRMHTPDAVMEIEKEEAQNGV
jgi:hypothetical protein